MDQEKLMEYIREQIHYYRIEDLKDLTFDQVKKLAQIVDGYESIQKKKKDPENLLTIQLKDESSVPVVRYKGEEVTLKQEIEFHWETSDAYDPSGLTYAIQHVDGTVVKEPAVNRIERRVGRHGHS